MTHRTRLLVLLLPMVSALAAAPLEAQQRARTDVGATGKVDPAAAAMLEKMGAAQDATRAMSAAFRQVKEDALFAEPSVQSGRFAFASPDKFRWDYERPERVIMVMTRDSVQRYLPDEKLLRKMDLSKSPRRVFAFFGIGSDVEVLKRHFDMVRVDDPTRPDTARLELRGKRRRVQKRVALLEMWMDRTTWLPAMIKTTMADGGTTLWEFTDVKVNPSLPPETFTVKIAQGTIVQSEDNPNSPLVDDLLDEADEGTGTSRGGDARVGAP